MNTNFGKLEDGILIYAPSVLRVGDKQIISPPIKMIILTVDIYRS